ncbi:MAG: sulfatase-like hydrolase/transferase [Deltaproteobacteria bacterium]|nr:sulfatase-like hydrolase/transferase [Deltaproteobacteria bacterium]
MKTGKLVLVLLLQLVVLAGCSRPKAPELVSDSPPELNAVESKSPSILVITVDTLRADRLGCYGFAAAQTPNIDRLSREGVRVHHAVAPAPITMPSHTSIFTGLDPPAHGVRDNGTFPVPQEIETLAERLKSAGYQTQAFVSAEVLHSRYGLDQGFDGYDDELRKEARPTDFDRQERTGDETMDRALQWLSERPSKAEPFFVWVHLFDPHQPYRPPASVQGAPTLYDGEIAFADQQIGRLIEAFEREGVLDETIVVFTSDHGESLGEHGEETHAVFIYESTIRVPLLVRYPPKLPAGKVYAESVRIVDIMPTVLGLAELAQPDVQGIDLSKALASDKPPPALPQYSESLYPELAFGMAPLRGVRQKNWTYIRAPRAELYDRASDPGETRNLLDLPKGAPGAADAKQRAGELDRLLGTLIEDGRRFGFVAQPQALDDDTVEMLQALGYMEETEAPGALRGMDPKDGVPIYRKVSEAFRLARDGSCPAAVEVLTPLLGRLPNLVQARNRIAKCQLKMGNPKAAKRQYLKSLAHDPNQEGVLLQLGRMQLAEGDAEGARQRFLQALEVIPSSVDAMVLLGHLDFTAGRPDDAKAWYRKAIEADPAQPIPYLFLGELHFRRGELVEARRAYEQARKVAPRDFTASLQLGICTLALGEPNESERYLLEASRIDPAQWKPFYYLACVKVGRGDLDSASSHLRKAVALGFSDARRLQSERCFSPLQTQPDFQELMRALAQP